MPRIVIHRTGESARVFELTEGRPISLGRAKSSNVVLDDPSVSRLHAVLRTTIDGRWQILDRESANGTLINGKSAKEALLHGNDEITLGVFRLRFEDSTERAVTSYGTPQLPRRVVQALTNPAHSGLPAAISHYNASTLVVEGISDSAQHSAPELRAQSQEDEKRLLALLQRVNQTFAKTTTVERLIHSALDFALEIPGAERGYVMLLEEESLQRRSSGSADYSFAPAQIRYRSTSAPEGAAPQLSISRSIIRQVMQAGLPMLVTDGQADPRFSASQSVVRAGIQSAMCAPLGIGNRLRGLLYVDNLSRRGMFTVDDLNVFAVIATQSGVSINRLRDSLENKEPALK